MDSHGVPLCRSASGGTPRSADSPRSAVALQPVAAALVTAGALPGTYAGAGGSGAPAAAPATPRTPSSGAAGMSTAFIVELHMSIRIDISLCAGICFT